MRATWHIGVGALLGLAACGGGESTTGTGGHGSTSSSSATGSGGSPSNQLQCKLLALAKTPVTVTQGSFGGLVGVTDGTLFWSGSTPEVQSGISRLKPGSTSPELVISDLTATRPMFVGSTLYYLDPDLAALFQASLTTVPTTGTKVADVPEDWRRAAFDDQAAYLASDFAKSITRHPFDGSASTVLSTSAGKAGQLVVFGGYVYFPDATTGSLTRVATSGGAPEVLEGDTGTINGLATDGTVVLYTSDDGVHRVTIGAISNTKGVRLLDDIAPPEITLDTVLFDSGHFYVTGGVDFYHVARLDPALSSCDLVADLTNADPYVAVAGDSLYYARYDQNTLYRVPK